MQTKTTPPAPSHVMLDLETLGNRPGSVIVSIGACRFADGQITDTFYRRIDWQSCVRAGLTFDSSTIHWWLGQEEAARLEICKPGEDLGAVLHAFAVWLNEPGAVIWGNGASFDNALLAAAYDLGITVARPWSHLGDRCYRTVKNANRDVPIDPYKTGTHHNALDDAKTQALHLMAIWELEEKQKKALGACVLIQQKLSDAGRFATFEDMKFCRDKANSALD